MSIELKFNNKKELQVLYSLLNALQSGKTFDYNKKTLGLINNRIKGILTKKPIKIASRKGKGRSLQYYICEKIASLFDISFNQQNDQCLIHSREMGQSGVDIILRDYVYDLFPFDIECKNTESPSIKDWIKQAKNNTKKDRNWLLVWKTKSFQKPVIVLDSDVFFNLLEKLYKK